MRLIEFIQQPEPAPEAPLGFTRVPLFYLGGSVKDYTNYVSTGLFESLMLNEAAISRYTPMIQVFAEIDSWDVYHKKHFDTAKGDLEWAMRVLKREDRITWYMRLDKAMLLDGLMNTAVPDNPNQEKQIAYITKEHRKAFGKLAKFYNGDDANIAMREMNSRTFYANMEHAMSMNIPKVDATVWGSQMPHELLMHFNNLEKEWMSKKDSVIDMDQDNDAGGVEVLVEFPDGHQWINLNRSSCTKEGAAMGHCGNTATNGSTETVLSLRQPVNERGQTTKERTTNHWRPRATFILETTNGMLGEMKGRNNQKPSEKLHPYIIGLLQLDMIKGVRGGGHAPEENFAISDLEDDVRDALIERKPALGTMRNMIELFGFDKEDVKAKISSMLDVKFTPTNKIIIEEFKNLSAFVDTYVPVRGPTKSIADMVLGEGQLNHDDPNHDSGDKSERQELANDFYRKHPDKLDHLKAYAKETYPAHFGYDRYPNGDIPDDQGDYDIDDVDDIIAVMEEEDDSIYDQIGWAISDGHRAGAESVMHESFWSWAADPFTDHGSLYFENDNQKYDSVVSIVLSTGDLMTIMDEYSDEGEFLDQIDYNGWADHIELEELDEPYYGWDGYNEDAALESFHDQVEIPETASYEIEHEGNAGQADADWMKKTIIDRFKAEEKSLGGQGKTIVTPDDTRISAVDVTNGVITMNVYPMGENQDVKLAQTLRKISDLSDERGVPVVVRRFNGDADSNLVGESGFKKVRHGYLRYEPPVMEAIKLRGFGVSDSHTGDLDGFLDELHKTTQPHPFNRGEVLYGSIGLDVSKFGEQIHLGDIVNYGDKGAGHGTNALRMLLNMADKYKVSISGTAKAYSNVDGHIQDTNQLAKWYEKHGFLIIGGYEEDGFDIIYHPDEEGGGDEAY
jgi:hypothetical protein